MPNRVEGAGAYFWEPEEEVSEKSNEFEQTKLDNYQTLAMKYPGAYKEFTKYTAVDNYLHFLLSLIDKVPSNDKERALNYLLLSLRNLTLEAMRKWELEPPPPKPKVARTHWDEVGVEVIREKSTLEKFLNTLGYRKFSLYIYTDRDILYKIGGQLVAIFENAQRLSEETLEGSPTAILETLVHVADSVEDDVSGAVTDSLEFLRGRPFEANIVKQVSVLRHRAQDLTTESPYSKKALTIAKYFTDSFPDDTESILKVFVPETERFYEICDSYKSTLKDLLHGASVGKKGQLLSSIAQNRENFNEKRLERTLSLIEKLEIPNDSLKPFCDDGPDILMDLDNEKFFKMIDMIKKHQLVTEKSNEDALKTIIIALLKIPEPLWEENIALALTISPAENIWDHLLRIQRCQREYQIISKHQLLLPDERSYFNLLYALTKITEEDLIRALPLIDKCPRNKRGIFVIRTISVFFDASNQEKERAVVNHILSESRDLTEIQLSQYVHYLMRDDNLKKVQEKDFAAVDALAQLLKVKL